MNFGSITTNRVYDTAYPFATAHRLIPMDASDPELSKTISASWRRFLEVYEPFRPDLYRYCRHLTRTPWDAEDLAQDTMARIQNYFFTPDFLADVCRELEVPFRTNGYRNW